MGVGMQKNFSLTPIKWLYGMVKYSLNKNERKGETETGKKNIHVAAVFLPFTNEEENLSCSP